MQSTFIIKMHFFLIISFLLLFSVHQVYVYYTIIFLFLHFFAGKCEVNPFRSGVRLIGSKLVQCKVQAYLYI